MATDSTEPMRTEVNRLGWWDSETRDVISRFLVNVCLANEMEYRNAVYLDESQTPEANTELAITEGLSHMQDCDFKCFTAADNSRIRIENAISYNWACRVRAKIPNAYLSFQKREAIFGAGVVELYLNGIADTAIEVMIDATRKTDLDTNDVQSRDIDDHLQRFKDRQDDYERFVLLNFALTKDKVVLPRDKTAHDKVYTFVLSSNTLYRGDKVLRCPAIPNLTIKAPQLWQW